MKRFILLMLCLGAGASFAASWRLNNNPGIDANFSTFAAAHDSVAAGDTIYVEGNGTSNSYGDIVINKKLIMIGPGYFLTENDSVFANHVPARFQQVIINGSAAGTEIHGLYIQRTYGHDIYIKASDVVISRNYFYETGADRIILDGNIQNITITQNYGTAVFTNSGTASNVLIANNYMNDYISLGSSSNAVIINNVVRNYISAFNSIICNNIIFVGSSYPLGQNFGNYNSIDYNLTAAALHAGDNPPSPPGTGNLGNVDMNTVFIDFDGTEGFSTDGKWMLNPDGPAAGAGENGIDCGMFGGSMPYVLSGQPAIPRIYEAIIPASGSQSGGLPVIIKVRSQN